MLPELKDIETKAGRISIGSTVRSTRFRDVEGLVTAIRWTAYFFSIEVDGRHSDNAANYELLSQPRHDLFNYTNPNAQQALSGQFEVLLPGEGDRIYFADTAEQAIALVAATVGLYDQEQEVKYLKYRAEGGPLKEVKWRGNAAVCEGQPAYISTSQQREAPRFAVGDLVCFWTGHKTNNDAVCFHAGHHGKKVSGVALYTDRRPGHYGKTQWHYFYEGEKGNYRPMSEADTSLATLAPVEA
jgi:hypothetical protein